MEWHNWLGTVREGGGGGLSRGWGTDCISQHLGRLESRLTDERIRLEENVCLSGSLDLNWGRRGRGVCGGSKTNSTG